MMILKEILEIEGAHFFSMITKQNYEFCLCTEIKLLKVTTVVQNQISSSSVT